MHLSGFDVFAWAAALIGHLILVTVLVVRDRVRTFPFFTAYIVEQISSAILQYFVFYHLSFHTFQYSFWSWGILDEILQLLVLYEIAVHIFCPTGTWASDVRKTLMGLVAASAVVAILLAWLAHPEAPNGIQRFILRSNFFSAMLMSELFVGTVMLSVTVGLPWKTHVARIAQGLGTYSIVRVAIAIAVNFVGLHPHGYFYKDMSHLEYFTYLACEGYWIVTLWAEAPAPRELPEIMRIQIYSLNRWVENDLIRIRAWRRN